MYAFDGLLPKIIHESFEFFLTDESQEGVCRDATELKELTTFFKTANALSDAAK
jgi:hypothetical protein